jgi:alkylhydroperoxidase family enzyme
MPRIEPLPWDALTAEQTRRLNHTVAEGGSPPDKTATRILVYAEHDKVPDDGDRHFNFPRHLLPGRLLEMLRIRSAQLGGCEPCMNARKVDSITDEVAACLIPNLRDDLSERERRALAFLDLLATDHHRIDDDTYRGLAEVFTTAEIVELGRTCGSMIGTHRFIHTLDPYGDAPPVIRYDPEQVGVTWSDLHGSESTPLAAGSDLHA